MAYEPKVGDYVTVTGRVTSLGLYGMNWVSILGGDPVAVPACGMEPIRDVGEAELRGEVGAPWAIALSEALDHVRARLANLESEAQYGGIGADVQALGRRVAALEAGAKVRDVPATIVNLASRVQGVEVTLGIELAAARHQGSRIDKIEHALAALAAVFRR